jgi:hypothetical protein
MWYLGAAMIAATACSSAPPARVDTQAVRDYVEVGELEDAEYVRTYGRDTWSYLSDYFVIYRGRNKEYLVEFKRACRELQDDRTIAADHRHDPRRMRANEDTVRGCRIGKIYPLTRAQAIELRNLGDSPGEGN